MDEKRLVDGATALAEKQSRVIKIEPAERPQNARLRVAAYTRVSSDSEDQLNSFAAQNRYYTELISGKAEWRMVDIYREQRLRPLLPEKWAGAAGVHREDGAVMGNRKQPFGYKMALGEIVIQEAEARLVQGIFRRYIAGESLNELTEALRQQNIPYDEGRLWNKNMVARILADIRYTGEKGYPKLIDEEQLIAANEKRSNKPQLPKKTEAQKVLRRLCGTPPSEQVEQSVTYLLNGLANYPDRIQHRRSPTPVTYSKTQEALDNTLEQQPIDEDSAKVLILRLAAEQYAALGNEEYETNRLRRLFSAFECVAELNADLLKNTVSEVLVTRQNVKLRLKNGQVIERSDLQ